MKYNVLKYNYIDLDRVNYSFPQKEDESEFYYSKCQYQLAPNTAYL